MSQRRVSIWHCFNGWHVGFALLEFLEKFLKKPFLPGFWGEKKHKTFYQFILKKSLKYILRKEDEKDARQICFTTYPKKCCMNILKEQIRLAQSVTV